MLITLPNADFSGAGLGQVQRFINGMPLSDLLGLWLFDDGADGDPLTSVADKSGQGNHAALRSGWTAGLKRSYGMEVATIDGTALQTAIPVNPAGRKMTVFVAGANTLPGDESSVFNNWTGSTDNEGMVAPTDSHLNGPALTLNYTGGDTTPAWQVFDNSSDMMGQIILVTGSNQPAYSAATVSGIEIDGTAGGVALHTLGAATQSVTNANVSAFYDGVTERGDLEFGPCAPCP